MYKILLIMAIFFLNFGLEAQFFVPDIVGATEKTMEYAKELTPSVSNVGGILVSGAENIISSTFNIFRLPLGVTQTVLGFPFGATDNGFYNIGKGVESVGGLFKSVVLLPFDLLGSFFPILNR